jgi:hypothetical protein
MRIDCQRLTFLAIALALPPTRAIARQVLDRIVARVENNIILFSDVRTLSRYQALVQGKPESDAQILDRLIDQWIVRSEADNAHFPRPSETAVARGIERVMASFDSAQEYEARKKEVGLSDAEIRNLVASQLYLSSYLESRFRPAVQIGAKEVEEFYETTVVARAQARNQAPPPLEASREYIQEALLERRINEEAERWLKESRPRLRIETFLKDQPK